MQREGGRQAEGHTSSAGIDFANSCILVCVYVLLPGSVASAGRYHKSHDSIVCYTVMICDVAMRYVAAYHSITVLYHNGIIVYWPSIPGEAPLVQELEDELAEELLRTGPRGAFVSPCVRTDGCVHACMHVYA